jgi:hypothetical protein
MLYAGTAGIALASGELEAYARDVRWPATFLIVALSAYYLVKLPEAIDRLWANLRPWLARSDLEVGELPASIRPILARYFLPSALVWGAFVAYWADTNNGGDEWSPRAGEKPGAAAFA